MGYYWSMGISFNDKTNALSCQNKLHNLILSDGRIVELKSSILLQTDFDIHPEYVLEIYPEEMEIDGRRKNLKPPFLSEIRDQLLQFVRELEVDFEIAFFELEGADRVTHENIVSWINESGIHITQYDNSNVFFNSESEIRKWYFEGLILSMKQYNRLNIKYPEFKYFKDGYMWWE